MVIDPLAIAVVFPVLVTTPVKSALVVTVEAVKLVAVPVILVPTKVVGVPRLGDVNVGDVESTTAPVPVLVLTPVPPFATGSMPETAVVKDTLVIVLLVPLMVLFVKVSAVALPTNISVAAGKVNVVVPATAVALRTVVPEVDPANVAPPPPMVGRVKVLFDND